MANIRKLLADEEFIQRITASGATAAAVHRDYVRPIYGFSVSSVNRAWKELEYQARLPPADPPSSPPTIEEHFNADDALQKDRAQLKAKAKQKQQDAKFKSLLRRLDEVEAQLDVALSLQEDHETIIQLDPDGYSPVKGEGAAFLVLSDWHIEERVDPRVVNGLNQYNPDIATARATRLFQNALKRIRAHRQDVNLHTLVLPCLGDFITGYIHEELEESNYLSPTEATLQVRAMLIDGISFLREHGDFQRIIVPCVPGNHGRTTKRKRIATSYKNSYEWMMYKTIAQHFAKDDGIEFIVPESATIYLTLFGTTTRLNHGDEFKYFGGIGGVSIPLIKWMHRKDEQIKAHATIIGHYHQTLMPTSGCMVNGSLIGINSYAVSIGCKPEPAQQTLRILTASHGFTTHEAIMCQ